MSRLLEEYKDIYSGFLKRARSLIVDGYWHLKDNRLKHTLKFDDFNHTQNATEGVLEALEILIQKVEGEREKTGVQPFINSVVDTIEIHLKRIKEYYKKNEPKTFKTKENQREEGKFQQTLFKGEQKIRSKMRDLNLENTMEGFSFDFFNDVKATLPFKEILCSRFPNIKEKVDTLDVDWDIILDNELHINKQSKDIPKWKQDLHFWDQEKETLEYWLSEYNKLKKGITIDGVYIHPWLYYHINFFKTPIGDEGDKILVPELRDNEWYLHEIIKHVDKQRTDLKDAGMAIFGTRRYGKSSGEASWSCFTILTNHSKNGVVCSTNEKDILALTDKVDIGITHLPPAFKLGINSKDWTKQVRFGLKTKSAEEIKYFYLDIINLDSGSKRGGQKLAGIAPVLFVLDEFAKEKFMTGYNALIPALETTNGWKTIPWLVGTGGDIDLSSEAEKALANPKSHRIVEMDWNLLNNMVPKEYRTWTERPFGFFIPAQMGQRTGHTKDKISLANFLKIESKKLSNIYIHSTNWQNNTEVCMKKRKSLEHDKLQLQKEIVYYPLDPEECFMSAKSNPFIPNETKKHRTKLISKGNPEYGTSVPIELYRREDDSVHYSLSNKEIAGFPHKGGFIDSPFLLHGDFPEFRPPLYRYIAGWDDYKHEESDGDSICGFYIFDRLKREIVLSLASRPDPHKSLYKQIHMALDAYNAKCFPENEDMAIKEYFDRIHKTEFYLAKSFDVYGEFSMFSTKRSYGWQPDKTTVPKVLALVKDYVTEIFETKDSEDEDNVIETLRGVERIKDIWLLEELIKYKTSGNYDRIVGFGSCLLYDYWLTSNYMMPQATHKNQEIDKTQPKQVYKKSTSPFRKTRNRLF